MSVTEPFPTVAANPVGVAGGVLVKTPGITNRVILCDGTVAAIEFLPVIALAALGARSARNGLALLMAVSGVYMLTNVRLSGALLGFVFAFANAGLFALYIVLADKVANRPPSGIDGLAAAMLIAAVAVTPIGGWQVVPALGDPIALLAGVGVGVSSSVIPYVTDQLAMARLPRLAASQM